MTSPLPDTPQPTRTARRLGTIGLAALAVAGVVGGTAAALATEGSGASQEPAATEAAARTGATATTAHDHAAAASAEAASGGEGDGGGTPAGHAHGPGRRLRAHPAQAPYDERFAAATPEERAAADELLTETRAGIAAYADPADAEAAGYRPSPHARGRLRHYLDRTRVADGDILDPSRPEGLVFGEGPDGPELLGAFYVAPAGTEVPADGGNLVTWHSHDPSCEAFFATPAAPCTDTRRMLHVWTVARADLVGRDGREHGVTVVNPFGAPFLASVEREG
jgi:hypothetical protein